MKHPIRPSVRPGRALGRALGLAALLLALVAGPPAAAEGLSPYDVARLRSVSGAEVSPDGEHVAYVLSVPRTPVAEDSGAAWGELWVVGRDGEPRPYVTGEVEVRSVSWTPDGKAIAFLAKRGEDEHRGLWSIPVAGGEARRLVEHEADVAEYSFSPDGARVAFLADTPQAAEEKELEEKGFDAEVYEEDLEPVKVWLAPLSGDGPAKGTALELSGSAKELHWSPAGDRLALTLAPGPGIDDEYMFRRVRVVDVASGRVVAEIANPGKLGEIAWSPDGRHLATISAADLNDPHEGRLMVVPAAGGELRDLLPGFEGEVADVAWRDADTIVYVASKGVETMVGSVGRDGSGGRTLLGPGATIWDSISLPRTGAGTVLVAESASHPDEVFHWDGGSGAPRRLTDSNPWLAERDLAPQEVVTFRARDGLELQGILIRPLGAEAGRRYPLILTVHGGPESHHTNGWLTAYSLPGQVAAARGFAVFYPNYRGSTGRGVAFSKLSQGDPAGKEFDDLVDAVDHLIASGLVDRAKVGITGGSYGGYATAWGSTYYTERFAAGVMFVGISELVSKIGTSDIPQELYLVHARRWPWESWQLMLERSPLHYVEKARTPLLILGGTDDTRVDPSQSLSLYRYLEVLGKAPVRLVRYPGEPHGNRKSAARLDYHLRMLRWFEHYLQGPGGDPPPADLDYDFPEEWTEDDEDGEEEDDQEDDEEDELEVEG